MNRMKALLLKDWYVIRKIILLYLAIVLATQVTPISGILFSVLYPALLPASAFAYDDRSRWGDLAAMMPYSLRDIVLSRYVLGWISIFSFSLAGLAARLLLGRFLPGLESAEELTDPRSFLMLLSVSAIFLDVSLPIYFRFDSEKGRLLRTALIAVICGILGGGYALLGVTSWQWGDGGFAWSSGSVALVPLALVLTAASVPLSMQAHRARYR